ncbi:hypothetical protein LR090_05370 [Candidatus Bipolaricaulota bacterium]|nr:hypothetical protein [Candidatus Bipolaricaulota bacterium]
MRAQCYTTGEERSGFQWRSEQDFTVTTSLMEHEIGYMEIYTEAVFENQ